MRAITLFTTVFLLLYTGTLKAQNVGINTTGTVPDASAGLDIDFSTKGLLIPRVALTSTTDVTTIVSPTKSLLVYNDGTGGLNTEGYYYWDGANWVKLVTNGDIPDGDWTIVGSDQYSAVSGNVGIGTTTPTSKLHVVGTGKIQNPGNSPDGSSIIFGSPANDIGIVINRGNGSGASLQRWDLKIDDDNSFRLRSQNTSDYMTLTNQGYLGVGTTIPRWQVTVENNTNIFSSTNVIDQDKYTFVVMKNSLNTNEGTGIGLGSNASGIQCGAGIVFKKTNINSLGDLMLTVKQDGTSYSPHFPAMTIKGISGNVGIGSTTPAEKLHVEGSIQMVDGNQQTGFVPVSDANGKMTWTDPATLTMANDGDWTISGSNQYSAVSGNVGIGTTSPSAKLQVTSSGRNIITIQTSDNTLDRGIAFRNSGTSYTNSIYVKDIGSNQGDLVFSGGSANPSITALDDYVTIKGGTGSNAGYVGIGTSTPLRTLHVQSSGALFKANPTATSPAGIEIMPMATSTNSGGRIFFREDSDDLFGMSIGYNGGGDNALLNWPANSFVISKHGNNATGDIAFITKGASATGIGGVTNPLNVLDVNGDMVIGTGYAGTSIAPTNGLLVQGRVGIGTTSTVNATLVVNGSVNNGNTYSYGYLNSAGNTGTSSGTNGYSIWASGRIRASEFNAMSDVRTKKILNRTETADMLDLINRLNVTEYAYIDSIEYGNKNKQGFIAQEIEQVLPNAVSKSTGFVPNVFEVAEITSYDTLTKMATLAFSKAHGLLNADHIKLITEQGDLISEVVKATESTITVKMESKPTRVFVYGKEVQDFRAVDYDQVFSLGIGAIQELSKKFEALKKENADLKADLEHEKSTSEERLQRIEEYLQLNVEVQR